MKTKKLRNYICIMICGVQILILNNGCKKFLEVELPIDKQIAKDVFSKTSTASLAVTGIYNELSNNEFFFGGNGFIKFGLLADELQPVIVSDQVEYINSISTSSPGLYLWGISYELIYRCNSAIEGLYLSTTIPKKQKEILLGEAKFLRAFLYFNLVNVYGDVPLVVTTNYVVNAKMGRTNKNLVFDAIVKDLLEAQSYLGEIYVDIDVFTPTNERIRPNRATATALLSKVYLYLNKWNEAEMEATKLIDSKNTYDITTLDEVFLKNSKEAIWQLQPTPTREANSQKNTLIGSFFINYQENGIYNLPSFRVSDFLLAAFEDGDQRKIHWITDLTTNDSSIPTVPIPFKYKVGGNTNNPSLSQEYTTMFRLSEQYLIRAEARARQGKILGIDGAQGDLDVVRKRAGLLGTNATGSVEAMLDAIDHERYVELFTESSADRWFNMKRRGTIDDRMSIVCPIKGGKWSPYKALFPIPTDEFIKNPSFAGHQNPGYTEY